MWRIGPESAVSHEYEIHHEMNTRYMPLFIMQASHPAQELDLNTQFCVCNTSKLVTDGKIGLFFSHQL